MKFPKDHPYMKRLDEVLSHYFVTKTIDPAVHGEDYEEMKEEITAPGCALAIMFVKLLGFLSTNCFKQRIYSVLVVQSTTPDGVLEKGRRIIKKIRRGPKSAVSLIIGLCIRKC